MSVLSLPAISKQSIIKSGLMAEYRFDEGFGSTVYDYSGNGYHATLAGITNGTSPTWLAGKGLTFDGVSNCLALGSGLVSNWTSVGTIQIFYDNRSLENTQYRNLISTSANNYWLIHWATGKYVGFNTAGTVVVNTFPSFRWSGPCGLTAVLGSTCKLYYGETEAASYIKQGSVTTASCSAVSVGAYVSGTPSISANAGIIGDVYYMLVYNRALSQPEISKNYQTVAGILARRGIILRNALATSSQYPSVVCHGDSITIAAGTSSPYGYHWRAQSQLTNPTNFAPFGVSGRTAATMVSEASVCLTSQFPKLHGNVAPNVYVLFAGTNDIGTATGVATTTYNNIKSLCTSAQSAGFSKVVVFDIMPRNANFGGGQNNAGFETDRTSINSSLASDFSSTLSTNIKKTASYADYLIQIGSDSNMGVNTWPNTTYFQDQLHPTSTGHGVIAGYLKSVLNDIGLT